MPRVKWNIFDPILFHDAMLLPPTTLSLNVYQQKIIRLLGQEGRMSIHGLKEARYPPLDRIVSLRAQYEPEDLKKKSKHETYHYAQIYYSIRKLEKKELVKTTKDTSGVRPRRFAELTFTGLVFFLRAFAGDTTFEKSGVEKAITKNYAEIIPFSKEWDKIKEISGKERALDRLMGTAGAFRFIQRIRFEVRKLDLAFQGFLRRPIASLPFPIPGTTPTSDRDPEFAEFMATNDKLMKAYIAYLAVQDINFLSYVEPEEIENWIDKLWSEKELAFFEKRSIQTNSLFSGKRLGEFFPKYAP